MYQKATHDECTGYCKVVDKKDVFGLLNPRKATLVFIMQFAYAYHVEPQLPAPLAGMIIN